MEEALSADSSTRPPRHWRAKKMSRPPSAVIRRYRAYALPLLYAGSAIRHWRPLLQLWKARRGSLLEHLVVARRDIWTLLRVRFVAAPWGTATRFERIVDHCNLVEKLGCPLDIRPNESATLLAMEEIGPSVLLLLDSPPWMFREGLLTLNIVEGVDRVFSLSFTLATASSAGRTAYVGGIQGRRGADSLHRNRAFTKAAEGTRPQDMLFELFRSLCANFEVTKILCVSDRIRNGRTAFAHSHVDYADPISFDYDAMWRARGGTLQDDGFFDLPLTQPARSDAEIPSKKRAARRSKLLLIHALQQRLLAGLSEPMTIAIHETEPA